MCTVCVVPDVDDDDGDGDDGGGGHTTPASSLCAQSWLGSKVQSRSLFSVPMQFTSSRLMGPPPTPN